MAQSRWRLKALGYEQVQTHEPAAFPHVREESIRQQHIIVVQYVVAVLTYVLPFVAGSLVSKRLGAILGHTIIGVNGNPRKLLGNKANGRSREQPFGAAQCRVPSFRTSGPVSGTNARKRDFPL